MSYKDRDAVKKNRIKVQLSLYELAELDAAALLAHSERAVLMRDLIMAGARSILEKREAAKNRHAA